MSLHKNWKTLLALVAISLLAACDGRGEGHGAGSPWRREFEAELRKQIEPFPPDRKLTVATNLWLPRGFAAEISPRLTLVHVGEERLLPFYRLDAYLAVNMPEDEDPTPSHQPRENPGKMLIRLGSSPLRPDERVRWTDLRFRNEQTLFHATMATAPRRIVIDDKGGLELGFRPWISLSESVFSIAGREYRGHELIRNWREGLEIVTHGDLLVLRYTRPSLLFRALYPVVKIYPFLLGSGAKVPVTGHAVWMDNRRGMFQCPMPSGEVQNCHYEELDAE